MKIKKIHITKYGPISNLDLDIGPGLQVISGRNEAGKTLTIDAVIKMLLQGKTRDFEDVNRVEEDPEGFILFGDSDRAEHKVNIKNGLAKHMELGGLDLRNIFIIRDSDLSLRDECGYYKNITDKLTGLQLEKIDTVMALIKDHGRLTKPSSDAGLSDNRDHGKIASLLSEAKSFETEGREYLESSGKENYDYLEFDQIKARQEILDTRGKIKIINKMLGWERYRKLADDLKHIKKQWKLYLEFKDFDQKNYDKISNLILGIDSFKEKLSGLGTKQEKDRFRRLELEEKLSGIQGRSDLLESR
ncbi:MAG: AAA family ATPase, partial [Actinomycetia bacterium]|nr:AAA family ATPase [Actinomycetes bacterium]